jgi:hypothetical protein
LKHLVLEAIMAVRGVGFFDNKGQFFKTPEAATVSDLAAVLGKVGDGESLAPGIAQMIFQRRAEIEHIFTEHDRMNNEPLHRRATDADQVAPESNIRALPKR